MEATVPLSQPASQKDCQAMSDLSWQRELFPADLDGVVEVRGAVAHRATNSVSPARRMKGSDMPESTSTTGSTTHWPTPVMIWGWASETGGWPAGRAW